MYKTALLDRVSFGTSIYEFTEQITKFSRHLLTDVYLWRDYLCQQQQLF